MTKVKKRDGRVVPFDSKFIGNAIIAAAKSAGYTDGEAYSIAEQVKSKVLSKIKKEEVDVEEIQDTVEHTLLVSKWKDIAKAFVTYRNERDLARKAKQKGIFLDIIGTENNEITRENANMNADTPAGMMMKFASETTKPFVKDFLLSEDTLNAMEEGYIYPHDLDYYPTKSLTCLQHPLDKILKEGFRAGHGASRPAKRIETASMIGCISMETVQNEMHGGQAIPAFDFYMAPYVRLSFIEEVKNIESVVGIDLSCLYYSGIIDYITKDTGTLKGVDKYKQLAINNTVKRVHQALEAFIHNMNTIHSRGGNQVVFSSVNYGTDTSPEGRCIIREMLNSTYEGVGNGETAIFPIQIWKKKRGVNYLKEDRNYDLYKLSCKVASKRFFPNYINLDATFNTHEKWNITDPQRFVYEAATMGCRTRVFENRHGEKTSIGRGNLSFTTINLPKVAIESVLKTQEQLGVKFKIGKGSDQFITDTFKRELKKNVLDLLKSSSDSAAKQLLERYNFQATATAKQFPLLMQQLWNGSETLKPEDTIREVIKQGSLSIGFIGLAEALVALTGKHHAESKDSQELGIEIITYLRDLCNEYSEEYDLNYSVIATPAEGLSGKFTRIDREKYGIILGVTDKEYYTNSNHVPVSFKCTANHKAKIEAPYHNLTRAGHIFYIELDGDAVHNPEAIEAIVDLMDVYNMGYGSVNHTRSRCLDCGFENSDSELQTCPKCGSHNIDVLQRITGYLVGTTDRWNSGKIAELKDRVSHSTGV